MKRSAYLIWLVTAAVTNFAGIAGAQSYDLSWHKIAGGGGTSAATNGSVVYSLSGTIGQADAGYMAGGSYSLTGGFWGLIATVQTPGSPFLSISAVTTNHVTLSWPSSYPGFALQENSSLINSNTWTTINTNTYPIILSGGTNTVTVPVGGNQFFRLVSP